MNIQLSPLFRDHMVLAAHKTIRVFGSGDVSGADVTVMLNGCSAKATGITPVGCGVTWAAELPAMPYGGPYELTVTTPVGTASLTDVYVGEVVLLAGQSNIQFKMKESRVENPEEFRSNPLLRLFTVDRIEDSDKYHECDGWVVCEKDDVENWSAIGYHTGMDLQEKLGCAVGLIACYQGASVIESWIPAGLCPELYVPMEQRHIDHTYPEYVIWNGDGMLYEAMFRKLIPMPLSSVVWYQGESDTTVAEAAVYVDELTAMIGRWREDLRDPALPFALVQIADFEPRSDAGWWNLQAAEEKAAEVIPHTALVVCRDVCETFEIHPATKAVLSARLADTLAAFSRQ